MCIGLHKSIFQGTIISFYIANLKQEKLVNRTVEYLQRYPLESKLYMDTLTERLKLANMAKTSGLVHADPSDIRHVLTYQNNVQNLSKGGNSMVLYLPCKGELSANNIINTENFSSILLDMKASYYPEIDKAGGMIGAFTRLPEEPVYTVVHHGIYSTILTKDPRSIRHAITNGRIPQDRIPPESDWFVDFSIYARNQWGIAYCCFNSAELVMAEPIMIAYEPSEIDTILLPAIDNGTGNSHSGQAPDPNAFVDRDHYVFIGSYLFDQMEDFGKKVAYNDPIPHEIHKFIPNRVIGCRKMGPDDNGDIIASHNNILNTGKLETKVLPFRVR